MAQASNEKPHLYPIPTWRGRANQIIFAPVPDIPGGGWEQLWACHIGDDQFEICCIPFFIYDVSLGDIVQTDCWSDDKPYVVSRILTDAGYYVFRVWFGDIEDQPLQHQLIDEVEARLTELGCELEWYSHDLLGAAIQRRGAQAVADYLQEKHEAQHIEFENGRTHH